MINKVNIRKLIDSAKGDFLQFLPESDIVPVMEELARELEEHAIETFPLYMGNSSFAYMRDFHFFDAEFTLFWDAHAAVKASKNNQLVSFPTSFLYDFVDTANLDYSKLPIYSDEPVLVAEIPFIPGATVVIDGNHRVASARMLNKDAVVGQIMTYNEHVNYMTPASAILFKVCCNIQNLSLFLRGQMSQEELNFLSFVL